MIFSEPLALSILGTDGERLAREPAELHGRLSAMGFSEIEDVLATELVGRYLSLARAGSRRRGAHVLRATNT